MSYTTLASSFANDRARTSRQRAKSAECRAHETGWRLGAVLPAACILRSSRKLGLSPPCGFEQEPCTPLGLIDPDLQQACGGNIPVLLAKVVCLADVCYELFVVLAQFGKHIHRRNKLRIIVRNALQAADVADRV